MSHTFFFLIKDTYKIQNIIIPIHIMECRYSRFYNAKYINILIWTVYYFSRKNFKFIDLIVYYSNYIVYILYIYIIDIQYLTCVCIYYINIYYLI